MEKALENSLYDFNRSPTKVAGVILSAIGGLALGVGITRISDLEIGSAILETGAMTLAAAYGSHRLMNAAFGQGYRKASPETIFHIPARNEGELSGLVAITQEGEKLFIQEGEEKEGKYVRADIVHEWDRDDVERKALDERRAIHYKHRGISSSIFKRYTEKKKETNKETNITQPSPQ